MPVDIGRDTGFRVTGSALNRVDRSAILQQDRDGGMAQIMETDLRKICLSQELLERS